MEIKRKITQCFSALLCNLNLKGLITGRLFRGVTKGFCVPGLNCYSCPAATGSCPLGALQSTLTTINRKVNLFVVGLIGLYSCLLGRWICGWLCPFGLLQEFLYLIPTKKYKPSLKSLRWVKYVILLVFVIAVPVLVMLSRGVGFPSFCKYICPQGTLQGTFLVISDAQFKDLVGVRFISKWAILVILLVLSVFLFRPFCRLLCPLGALYGLFNSIALVHIRLNPDKCSSCGACKMVCPVEIDPARSCNSAECIRCGKCVSTCSTQALHLAVGPKEIGKKTGEKIGH